MYVTITKYPYLMLDCERRAEMERLTAISENGKAYYPYCFREDTCDGCGSSEKCDQCELSLKVCETLAAYENTDLTPPEILELKERGTAKAVQKVDEQPYFRKHFHDYVCPVCHKKIELRWKFCGHCGQRLKKENDYAENT